MDNPYQLVQWSSISAVLGWIYVTWACLWPRVFDKAAIRHATYEAAGYRIGGMIHWRLPLRPALLLTILFLIPLLVTTFFRQPLSLWLLATITGIMLALWFINPPGMRLILREKRLPDGKLVFELQASRKLSRSIAIFILWGLIPALIMGTGLNWLLVRFIIRN